MHLSENTFLQGGKYRIIRTLGQGGFGITYLALQTGLGREVVVKEFFMRELCDRVDGSTRVSLGTSSSRELVALFLDKFLKEARSIATLKHANIISIYDVFEENDTAYYVMEYHGAGSLGSLVDKRGALNEEDALFYICQVAAALKYVHARKMMHLDVKPDNILIDEDGNAVLIDFGLSKHYNEKGKATSAASTYGTSPGYTPMEQYGEGGVGEFSPATDIYSLGATLFTLLTGEIPPPALRLVDSRSLQSDLAEKNVSGAVAEAVIKSMSFMREARPQSIDEFLALLDAQPAAGSSSRPTQPMAKSGGSVSRPTQPMVKSGGVSRPTGPMNNNGAATADNEPKKLFNWKIPVGIVAAILCVVFAGVGINNCNEERAEQERLAIIEKARRDSIATARKAAEDKRISDSIAAVQQRLLAENAALKQAAEQRRRDSIANLPGKLYVTTTPAGATVTVDGKRIGTTPINAYELKKGSYNVKIAKEGYKEYTERITITAEPANINATLVLNTSVQKSGTNYVVTVNGVSFIMVAVTGGTFNMGSNDGYSEEKPVHSVTLGDYYIGETEVTQALWQAVMGRNPSHFKGSNNPVEQVNYNDCKDFINKLNTLLAGQLPAGRKFRLPTEAEWEFAARGGNKGKNNNYKYSGSNSIDAVAWWGDDKGNSNEQTHPVKGKQPNELGLYDMTGNVREWCYDWKGSYSSSPQTNPQGPSSGSYRVLRGGDWCNDAHYCRVAYRSDDDPDGRRVINYGLRLAF